MFLHEYVITEFELGERVARAMDEKDSSGWDALLDLSYEEYLRGRN